jgi:hypothetical protein
MKFKDMVKYEVLYAVWGGMDIGAFRHTNVGVTSNYGPPPKYISGLIMHFIIFAFLKTEKQRLNAEK